MPHIGPKLIRTFSMISFGIFATCLAIFIIIALFAQYETITLIVPTITHKDVLPTRTIPGVITINTIALFNQPGKNPYNQDGITSVISPVVPIISTSVSGSITNTPPIIPTNMVQASTTFGYPLQVIPQSVGFSNMTTDGSQLLCSMQNGEVSFGQFLYDPEKKTYDFASEYYVTQQSGISNSNRILATVSDQLALNVAASAVGCVGIKSIALSQDDLRLYVAYRDSNISDQNPYAFQQTVGKVQVWSRAPGPDNTNVDANPAWQHVLDLKSDMINPFGSQIFGIPVQNSPLTYNSFTEKNVSGDEFGAYMVTSGATFQFDASIAASPYRIAISAQTGISMSAGRCICVFQEMSDLSYSCEGVLSLPFTGNLANTFTVPDRTSFGNAFCFVDDTCIASVGAHNNPESCRLANFRRINDTWEFIDVIQSPVQNEFFGTSMVMAYYGSVMVVGSPLASTLDSKTIPIGGHVYTYVRDNVGIWNLTNTLQDPFLSNSFPNVGTFGWFVNASRDFRMITVSANQDSVYRTNAIVLNSTRKPNPGTCSFSNGSLTSACTYTNVEVFAFNQVTNAIDTKNVFRIFQDESLSQFIDPLFGANVSISFTASQGVLILTGSCLNQNISLFQMGNTS